MASALDRLSTPELEKLCVLAFWLGLGSDRAMSWGESRDEMKIFLSGVARQPERQALAEVLSPEDSDLLLRWTTWSGVPPLPPESPGVSQ